MVEAGAGEEADDKASRGVLVICLCRRTARPSDCSIVSGSGNVGRDGEGRGGERQPSKEQVGFLFKGG